ncbi:hypothetical protein, partial [Phocaeicola plebeius]|uniref:hypothetical protein n=1 Tax=Phocaeicola plebeius TaxID=310297 RepID=UPI003FEF53A7
LKILRLKISDKRRFTRNVLLLLPHPLENILKTNKLERTKVFAGGTSPSSGFFMFFHQMLN